MLPWRPRASPRSRGLVCGPRGSRRRASTSMTCTRHSGGLHDAADHNAVSEHVEIVVVPFARRARSGGALEDQIVLVHFTEPICAVSLDHLVGAGEQGRWNFD